MHALPISIAAPAERIADIVNRAGTNGTLMPQNQLGAATCRGVGTPVRWYTRLRRAFHG
jgi:hypothetical protein